MNKRLYELKKETNYCAGVGEIACLLEHIGEAVVLVNGPRFCYLQMKRILQQMLPFSIEDRLYCSDVDENAIVFGTEGKVKKVLRQIKTQKQAITCIGVVNSCAVSLIGEDILGIVAEEIPDVCCLSMESGAMTGDFWDGYNYACKMVEQAGLKVTFGCLRGYSLCYYNAYYDMQEIRRLLRQGLNLQYQDFPAIASELSQWNEGILASGIPYGYTGTWQWLEKIAKQRNLSTDKLQILKKESEANYKMFNAAEFSLQREWGSIYFPIIVVAAPESVAYALAKSLTMELAGFDKMYLIIHGKRKQKNADGPYKVVRDMDDVLQDNSGSAILIIGSSIESEQYIRRAGRRAYFIAISQPVYDDISCMPLAGITGYYNLKKLLWQQYIQMRYDKIIEAER